jgi:hypothetical protein
MRRLALSSPLGAWFHDVLHADGTPYREREAQILRTLSAAPKGVVPDTLDLAGDSRKVRD